MDKIVDSLVGQAPAVLALIWCIRYFGAKIDRLSSAIYTLLDHDSRHVLRDEEAKRDR